MRGPRPPSEKWPTVQKAVGRWRQEKPTKFAPPKSSVSIPEYNPSRAPEVVFAVDEVKRLEVAIQVLGGDNVHAKGLQAALRSARAKSKVLPVSELMAACTTFVGPRNGFSELQRPSTKASRRKPCTKQRWPKRNAGWQFSKQRSRSLRQQQFLT